MFQILLAVLVPLALASWAFVVLLRSTRRPYASNSFRDGAISFCATSLVQAKSLVALDPAAEQGIQPALIGTAGDPDAEPPVPPTDPLKVLGAAFDCNLDQYGKVCPLTAIGVGVFGLFSNTQPVLLDPASGEIQLCDALFLSNWYVDEDGNYIDPATVEDPSAVPGAQLVAGVTNTPSDPSVTCLVGQAFSLSDGECVEMIPPTYKQIADFTGAPLQSVEILPSDYDGTSSSIPLPAGKGKPVLVFLGGNLKREGIDYVCNGGQIDILNQPVWNSANDYPLVLVCPAS